MPRAAATVAMAAMVVRFRSVRGVAAAAVAVLAALAVAGYVWIGGGARLRGSAFPADVNARVGQTVSVGISLWTSPGGEVTLLRARAYGADPSLKASVSSVMSSHGVGSYLGDLPFDAMPVRGVKVRGDARPGGSTPSTPSTPAVRASLVVSVVAGAPGTYSVTAVDVTYRSGLRQRTARLPMAVRVFAA